MTKQTDNKSDKDSTDHIAIPFGIKNISHLSNVYRVDQNTVMAVLFKLSAYAKSGDHLLEITDYVFSCAKECRQSIDLFIDMLAKDEILARDISPLSLIHNFRDAYPDQWLALTEAIKKEQAEKDEDE